MSARLYPHCGCPPPRITPRRNVDPFHRDEPGFIEAYEVTNLVCRNADCSSYGTHRRGLPSDRCPWCSTPMVELSVDVFRGAR